MGMGEGELEEEEFAERDIFYLLNICIGKLPKRGATQQI